MAIQLHSPNALHETGRQHKCFASFFRNNEVLVLKLHQEDAYLFLIKSECVNKFDYHVLEDFNTYAERWESAQIAKGKKEKFWEELKEQRTPIDRKPVKAKKKRNFSLKNDLPVHPKNG